jgi:AAA domain
LIEQGRAQLVATALDVSKAMQARFRIPLRLIVIDTMLAEFDIRDWNDPAETRRVMNTLSRIAEETSTVVLGIHHHGKDVARGAAGSYALTAAADFVLSVFADIEADGGISNRRITASKLRDGPTGWGCDFELKPFKIGVDDEGENITSAFVEPKSVSAGFGKFVRGQKKKAPAQSSTAFVKAFEESLQQFGIDRTCPSSGKSVRAVRVSDVRASFARKYCPEGGAGKAGDAQRQAFTRALKAALAEGTVKQDS